MTIKYSTFHLTHVILMGLAVALILGINWIIFLYVTLWITNGGFVLGLTGFIAFVWAVAISNMVMVQGFAYWNKNINMDVSKTGIEVQTTSGNQNP